MARGGGESFLMSVPRLAAAGCVLSDGRFAVFGGWDSNHVKTASCKVLTLDGDERWEPLPPMHEARSGFTCAAVGGCVVVAGGTTVEVYEEALGRWRRLRGWGVDLSWMESALM
jgi:hypothetical protein